MRNITLAVDDKLLAAVREYADENKTSVNALVREALEAIAARGRRSELEWNKIFETIDAEDVEVGRRTWSRDDLHDR